MEKRTYPVELLRLKRLLAKMYADDSERSEAGYKGETAVDNYLRGLRLPCKMKRAEESGDVLTMECPILQLENQKAGLNWWLEEKGLSLQIGNVVAMATHSKAVEDKAGCNQNKKMQRYMPRVEIKLMIERRLIAVGKSR